MVSTDEKYGVGILTSRQAVEKSVQDLADSSFPIANVAIFAKDAKESDRLGEIPLRKSLDNHNLDTTGTIGNALSIGFWLSVLVGLSSLVLPGEIGAILATIAIATALVISVVGVGASIIATNKLVKLLTNLGIPEERARRYSDRIQSCEYLLILTGKDEDIHNVETILQRNNIQYWDIYQPTGSLISHNA